MHYVLHGDFKHTLFKFSERYFNQYENRYIKKFTDSCDVCKILKGKAQSSASLSVPSIGLMGLSKKSSIMYFDFNRVCYHYFISYIFAIPSLNYNVIITRILDWLNFQKINPVYFSSFIFNHLQKKYLILMKLMT